MHFKKNKLTDLGHNVFSRISLVKSHVLQTYNVICLVRPMGLERIHNDWCNNLANSVHNGPNITLLTYTTSNFQEEYIVAAPNKFTIPHDPAINRTQDNWIKKVSVLTELAKRRLSHGLSTH